MASIFGPPFGTLVMLASEYEVDLFTHNVVMADFTCIHYIPV